MKRRRIFSAAITLALAAICAPAPAFARDWIEGSAERPLSVGSTVDARTASIRGDEGVQLEQKVFWTYTDTKVDLFQPFSAQQLSDGTVLITDRDNVHVSIVTQNGKVQWSYSRFDDPLMRRPNSAQGLPNGNVLITDRGTDSVFEVERDTKRIVWRYGATPNSMDPGSLYDPYSAFQSPDGQSVVICDNLPAGRVIEVRKADYDTAQPDLGYSAASIMWSYGIPGSPGTGPGQLSSPRKARKLANGNVLIADSEDSAAAGHRVIEVDRSGTIVWRYGVDGVSGDGPGLLNRPSDAQRLANGNTVIVEEDGSRMLEVDRAGNTVENYGRDGFTPVDGELGKVRSVQRTPQGTTLVADQLKKRVLEFGYARTGSVTSSRLSLGLPGVKKEISSIHTVGEQPAGASFAVDYALDGAGWQRLGADGRLPDKTVATELRYRITLGATDAYTPVLREVHIVYDVATEDPASGTDDGDDAGTPTGGSAESTKTSTGSGKTKTKSTTTSTSSGSGTTGSGSGGVGTGTGYGAGSGGAGSQGAGADGTGVPGAATASEGGPATGSSRFTQGTLMQAVSGGEGAEGFGHGGATGGFGGAEPRTVAALSALYLAGLAGASLSRQAPDGLLAGLLSRIGWR